MVEIKTADCVGVELRGNSLHGGNGNVVGGAGKPAISEDNRHRSSGSAERPAPPVASIYEWQQGKARR